MITRILTAVVLIFACSTLMAQSKMYQPVRVDVTLSAPLPMGGTGGYGIGGCIDAKYNLLDQLAVGLRIEGAAMMGGSIADTGKIDIGVTAVTAYLVKGEYYFTKGSNVTSFWRARTGPLFLRQRIGSYFKYLCRCRYSGRNAVWCRSPAGY